MICLLTVDHAAIHEYPGAGPRTLAHSLLRKVGDLPLAHTHRTSLPSAPFGTPTRTPLFMPLRRHGVGTHCRDRHHTKAHRPGRFRHRCGPPPLSFSYPTLVHLLKP